MGTSVDFIVVASAECLANGRYVGDVLYFGQEQIGGLRRMTAQRKRDRFPKTEQVPVQREEEPLNRVLCEEMSSKIYAITFMAEELRARLEASQSPEADSALEIKERLADLARSIRSR